MIDSKSILVFDLKLELSIVVSFRFLEVFLGKLSVLTLTLWEGSSE